MPKINHPDIGNIAKTKYLTGIITEITADDTCSVALPGQGEITGVPVFFHCDSTITSEEPNGSLKGGSGAFAKDDSVIVKVTGGQLRVIGHADGVKRPCVQEWQFRLSVNGVIEDPGDFLVFDKFTILFRDAGSTSDPGISAEEYTAIYGVNSAFVGFKDNFVRGGTIGEADLSDGSYDPVTKIMKFSSVPKDWTPVFPSTATATYRVFNNNFFIMYPGLQGGEDYVNGEVIKAGQPPGPVFTLLGIL